MSSKRISEMDAATVFNTTDIVPIVDANGNNKKVTGAQVKAMTNTGNEYHAGDTFSVAGTLCEFWQTGTSLRITIPLSKPIGSDVSTITNTGNREIRMYNGTTIATGYPLSDYGTVNITKGANSINIQVTNLNSTWGDTSRYTSGGAYANAGNTITFS